MRQNMFFRFEKHDSSQNKKISSRLLKKYSERKIKFIFDFYCWIERKYFHKWIDLPPRPRPPDPTAPLPTAAASYLLNKRLNRSRPKMTEKVFIGRDMSRFDCQSNMIDLWKIVNSSCAEKSLLDEGESETVVLLLDRAGFVALGHFDQTES